MWFLVKDTAGDSWLGMEPLTGGEIYLPGHHHLGELPGDMSDSVIRFATIKCALVKIERTDMLHLSESGNYS